MLAVLSVLGAAALAVVHRPVADSATRQWLRAYGVEVAVPAGRWRLTDASEAITYGADATVRAPAVLDEGFCPSSDSSSRAFLGLLPPVKGELESVVTTTGAAWVRRIAGSTAGRMPGPAANPLPRFDADVPVGAGPCTPTTVHVTAVGHRTTDGVVVLLLVRDVGEPDDLSAAAADEIVQSLRNRT